MPQPSRYLLFLSLNAFVLLAVYGQNQSVLSSGEWFKVGITENGIYKLDQSLLEELGIQAAFDPSLLQLFGNAIGMLPQANQADRPDDLLQNSIQFVGDDDAIFEQDEYFLFYGKGPHELSYANGDWQYAHNVYSDTSYYFIQVGETAGHRISGKDAEPIVAASINHDQHMITYSPESTNLLQYVNSGGSGREWYGDLLIPSTGLAKTYDFDTPNLLDSLIITFDVIGFSERQTSMEVALNENLLGNLQINASTVSTYSAKGRPTRKQFEAVSNGERQSLLLDFIRVDGSIYGFINQILLSYRRALNYQNSPLFFNNLGKYTQHANLSVTASEELTLWDLSDATTPGALNYSFDNNQLQFTDTTSLLKNYVVFKADDITKRPVIFGKVGNQNIRSLAPSDGLIITAPRFLSEANRLANHHITKDQLNVAVVTTQQIYNEFSSGMQDVTAIRDAIRHYYEKDQNLRYVLLFGDCSFDYKDRVSDNTNFVPIYESYNSWDPVLSYSSDDFFGFMESDEGEWRESQSGDHSLEIGMGRLPVKSLLEARETVNKIIHYDTQSASGGSWKNSMTYVVDDGNAGLSDTWTHMEDAEDFIDLLWENHPQVEPEKLYIDAFPQEILGNTESSQSVRNLLAQKISEGTFMVNFIGHGSEQRWTEETVLDLAFIRDLANRDRLPVFVTATCEFGRYDDPTLIADRSESGAEKLLLKPEGGAIALITTTRPVYAFTNYDVNRAFHFFLMRALEDGPEAGKLPRLGDIIKETKNNSLSGAVNRNFALLGDPMLRLDYPDLPIAVTSINNRPISSNPDTLKALQEVSLQGRVNNFYGNTFTSFNGKLNFKLYDTFTEALTLGQRDDPFPYKVRENVLFDGAVSVVNGTFEVNFIMPKNISYQFEKGAISMYAFDPVLDQDASGGFNQVLIGGSNQNPAVDNISPEVSILIDRSGFSSGQKVSKSDTLLALISDQSGINMTGLGLNRDITLTLNDSTFVINHLYQAGLNTFQEGSIKFPLSDLSSGFYTATLNLYDIHNNQSTATVDFVVTDQPTLSLNEVALYPNPAKDHFSIEIDHDRTNETLDITMELLSADGKLVMSESWVRHDFAGITEPMEVGVDPRWLQNGIYYCRISVISRLDGAIGGSARRLIIIN